MHATGFHCISGSCPERGAFRLHISPLCARRPRGSLTVQYVACATGLSFCRVVGYGVTRSSGRSWVRAEVRPVTCRSFDASVTIAHVGSAGSSSARHQRNRTALALRRTRDQLPRESLAPLGISHSAGLTDRGQTLNSLQFLPRLHCAIQPHILSFVPLLHSAVVLLVLCRLTSS